MRRMVMTAAYSAFGMTVLELLEQRNIEEFEWIYGTYFDAKEALDDLLARCHKLAGVIRLRKVNMKEVAEIEAFCEELSALETPTDFVHLPAPKAYPMQFKKLSWDVFQDHYDISFRSAVLLSQAILPAMAKKKEGRVVLMSSYYGTEEGTPNFLAPYVSTKAAVLGLMRALAKEYGPKNLYINALAPDLTDTKFLDEMPEIMKETAAAQSSRGRMLAAEEVADILLSYLDVTMQENGKTVIIK